MIYSQAGTATARRARRPRPPRKGSRLRLQPVGGLIAIGGPPCEGKSTLAARLADLLPDALRLEAIDNLSRRDQYWYPNGPQGSRIDRPETKLLAAARTHWDGRRLRTPPTLLVVARFGTPMARRRARQVATGALMPFLFVEARSGTKRALRRAARALQQPEVAVKRMERYERAKEIYVPVDRRQISQLPAVKLKGVLKDLEAAAERVVDEWLNRAG